MTTPDEVLFPPALLTQWEKLAAPMVGRGWRAHMQPMVDGGRQPVFTLTIRGAIGGVEWRTVLSGVDQDALLAMARTFHEPKDGGS